MRDNILACVESPVSSYQHLPKTDHVLYELALIPNVKDMLV